MQHTISINSKECLWKVKFTCFVYLKISSFYTALGIVFVSVWKTELGTVLCHSEFPLFYVTLTLDRSMTECRHSPQNESSKTTQ